MSLNIDEFKSAISSGGGLAKNNLFLVSLPTNIPGQPVISSRTLNLICKDVVLPGRQITTNERVIGMKPVKHAYGYLEDDVAMTFHVLNDYKIKSYFEAWQNSVIDFDTNELNYHNEYTRDVAIRQLVRKTNKEAEITQGIGSVVAVANLLSVIFGGNGILSNNQVSTLLSSTNTIYSCRLENAFPTTLNPIQLTNDADGTVELNVQLSYKTWRQI